MTYLLSSEEQLMVEEVRERMWNGKATVDDVCLLLKQEADWPFCETDGELMVLAASMLKELDASVIRDPLTRKPLTFHDIYKFAWDEGFQAGSREGYKIGFSDGEDPDQ